MKNHWIEAHRQKQARWWSVEFNRNGAFLLEQRRVIILDSNSIFSVANSNASTSIAIMFAHNVADSKLLDFLREAKISMGNMYARVRLQYGVYPFLVELKNHELTGLSYYKIFSGQRPMDVWFSFRFNHLRTYTS